ncbi:MAG: transposase, partial [Clostridiales bacterium]|nr:transposase [Clostridiales bacterium]
MEYRYELHCHTGESSSCSKVGARELVRRYRDASYSGVVITDHLSLPNALPGQSWDEIVRRFLLGYQTAAAAAPEGFRVMLGMELRFHESENDYLVYGFQPEFLYRNPDLLQWDIRKFSQTARRAGFLLIQAHPFRNGMTVCRPELLDGIEISNGNHNHDSRNDFAAAWAEKFGLIGTSGSDFHDGVDLGRGGFR